MIRRFLAATILGLTALAAAPAQAANALAAEKSRYLRDHADNPVQWHAWSAETLAMARKSGRPIFLSVGYASCHWCHVMERESFENAVVADLLNKHFTPILVDREEHPDVDATYLAYVQAMTGSAGWPMNLVLTPDLQPLVGGTYMKPDALSRLLVILSNSWVSDRKALLGSSAQLVAMVRASAPASTVADLPPALPGAAAEELGAVYDKEHGGFGIAPKFPEPVLIDFLLRHALRTRNGEARAMAVDTLRALADSGLHDHIGGGFHRYAVDDAWRLPHFEKMLTDQALLAIDYTEAAQITGDEGFADVARSTLDYVLRDLRDREGGFYSGQDADSLVPLDGGPKLVEGAFYTWQPKELVQILGQSTANLIIRRYGVTAEGNVPAAVDPAGAFKGLSLLYVAEPLETVASRAGITVDELKKRLVAALSRLELVRSHRPQPFRDDKVLTGWNGLAISALARAGAALNDPRYVVAASQAARFIESRLWRAQSKTLLRRYAGGQAGIEALPEDYAYFIEGLIDLYQSSYDVHWLERAVALQQRQDALFFNSAAGRYSSGSTLPSAVAVSIGDDETTLPTPNSVSVMNLLRLGELTDSDPWRRRAAGIVRSYSSQLGSTPAAMPAMLSAWSRSLLTSKQIVIAGDPRADDTQALLRAVHGRFIPNLVLIVVAGEASRSRLSAFLPIVTEMKPLEKRAAAYVCEHYVCKRPTTDADQLVKLLD
jgi:uncharacterized protein YyaL (SSP411 family)